MDHDYEQYQPGGDYDYQPSGSPYVQQLMTTAARVEGPTARSAAATMVEEPVPRHTDLAQVYFALAMVLLTAALYLWLRTRRHSPWYKGNTTLRHRRTAMQLRGERTGHWPYNHMVDHYTVSPAGPRPLRIQLSPVPIYRPTERPDLWDAVAANKPWVGPLHVARYAARGWRFDPRAQH